MRTVLLAFLLAFTSQTIRAATAYEALRVVGKQRGEGTLDKVIELRGERGSPQPREWKVIVKDPAARAGVKEFDVQGTRLAGERTPAAGATGSPLDMSQLNLDSDGAHQIAERDAKKAGFAYDHADYTLRAGTHGGSPVWEVRLVDNQTGDIATITMAATTGKVLSSDGLTKRRRATPVAQPPAYVGRGDRPADANYPAPEERYEEAPQPAAQGGSPPLGVRVNKFFNRVGRHMDRRFRQLGDAVHNTFSKDKRDTAGPHHPESEGDRLPPGGSSIDEDYTRPSRVRD